VYRVNEQYGSPEGEAENGATDGQAQKPKFVELLREEEKFSRKPIQQLAIIKEASILISLSDAYVSFYDLQSYALSERLDRTRGASSFAVMSNVVKDPESGIPGLVSRLAVAVKRKILVWTWRDMELTGEAEELSLFASVKSMTWATGTKLVAGMDPGFVMVDVEKREIADIMRPSGKGEPSSGSGTRFGAVNSSGMSVMGMGGWVPKPMIAKLVEGELLLAKDVNTLFIDSDGKAIEKRQVPWAQAPEAIGYSYPYLLALQPGTRGSLELRNPDTLSLLQRIEVPGASILHVPNPHISLAHAGKGFLVASERTIWRMRALGYSSQLDELLERKQYDEALSLTNLLEDTLLLDKEARLREIRTQKAQWLFDAQKYRDALDLFSEAGAPPHRVIALYPPSIAGAQSKHELAQADETPPDSIPSAGHSDAGTSDITAPSAKGDSTDKSKTKDKKLEGRDLVMAVHELRAFLAQTRVQLQKYINFDGSLKPGALENKAAFEHIVDADVTQSNIDWQKKLFEAATLVDTTLFRAYMLVSPSLAGSLFRLDNFCAPEVVEEALYANGRYSELMDFLHGKRLHKDVLEMLEKFGKGEADGEIDETFRGPSRMVRYLQQLPPEMIDLILKFAEWPLKEDADLGMEIFLADTEIAETLPREKVVEFLDRIDVKLSLKYLEHIVDELDDQTPIFHDRLVTLTLERVKQDSDEEDRLHWQKKLEEILQNSKQYNKYRALRDLPQDGMLIHSRSCMLANSTCRSHLLWFSRHSPLPTRPPHGSPLHLRLPDARLHTRRRLLQHHLPLPPGIRAFNHRPRPLPPNLHSHNHRNSHHVRLSRPRYAIQTPRSRHLHHPPRPLSFPTSTTRTKFSRSTRPRLPSWRPPPRFEYPLHPPRLPANS